MKKVLAVLTVLFMTTGFWVNLVMGMDYPTKPITIIVPWGAGGMSNVSTRMLGEKMKAILGQPIVYINKPGASGVIGLNSVPSASMRNKIFFQPGGVLFWVSPGCQDGFTIRMPDNSRASIWKDL